MGRTVPVSHSSSASDTRASFRTVSMSGTMTARGLSGRFLRRRRAATASWETASQARWNPPRPLTAHTPPPASSRARAVRGSPSSRFSPFRSMRQTFGPHTGQALGWAWKRRSRGVGVFRPALRAHGKAGHGGEGPVIGNGAGDGPARPAIGAVGEGIEMAAVAGVVHLRQTVGAGGRVRADEHAVPLPGLAGADGESLLVRHRVHLAGLQGHDAGQGRQILAHLPAEVPGILPLDLNDHALRGVEHEPAEPLMGEAVDEGPEPYALDLTGDHIPHSAHGGCHIPAARVTQGPLWRAPPGA